jgi:hypothetical protein
VLRYYHGVTMSLCNGAHSGPYGSDAVVAIAALLQACEGVFTAGGGCDGRTVGTNAIDVRIVCAVDGVSVRVWRVTGRIPDGSDVPSVRGGSETAV